MAKETMKLLRSLIKPLGVGIIVGVIFLTYMIIIGIPKTKAAGYYEIAIQQNGLGATKKADEYFKKAIDSFPEAYILTAYQNFLADK